MSRGDVQRFKATRLRLVRSFRAFCFVFGLVTKSVIRCLLSVSTLREKLHLSPNMSMAAGSGTRKVAFRSQTLSLQKLRPCDPR